VNPRRVTAPRADSPNPHRPFGVLPCLLLALVVLQAPPALGAIDSNTLAVLVNDRDPTSIETAAYYASARSIPAGNVVHVDLPNEPTMSRDAFERLRVYLTRKVPDTVQAYAVMWLRPYRVDCMSLTTALTFGFDENFCASTCTRTQPSTLYASDTVSPWTDLKVRPAMMVATDSVAGTKALIDRGFAARLFPGANAYLVTSGDRFRDIRGYAFSQLVKAPPSPVTPIAFTGFRNSPRDALFYFTGAVRVPDVDKMQFHPGAIADHVTSSGAVLEEPSQMTALEWLNAGATASYGTAFEPCAFPEKFPNPEIVVRRYVAGEPLVSAYWKSVRMPGQGVFFGEPLATLSAQ